ncbi:hypothetical protein DFQ28_009309 [Apophysomyces sp. BC1034]|nr:hypothetical protein DFQ30_009065 [Apophysomyces sp. BC1015]KAG0173249.1 hypothetical protein DFQ29_008040 [Apophysomyces sp. BC1021]KAG0185439.1 hypothetical protein DFQ28_009309 [Apophysomyces sp. BC1034]
MCERCRKMYLPCLFKFTTKPKLSKKPLTVSKRNRVLDDIWNLELQVTAMEDLLGSHDVAIRLQQPKRKKPAKPGDQSTDHPTPPDNRWSLVLSRKKDGLRLDTSIRTTSDIMIFLNEAIGQLAAADVPRTPLYHTNRIDQSLQVVIPILPIELMLRQMFREAIAARQFGSNDDFGGDQSVTYLKAQFINMYFNCLYLVHPIIVRSLFQPYLNRNLNSMLATALAAAVAYSQCQHINLAGFPFTRQELGTHLRKQARAQLETVLFDEPTLLSLATLWYLLECSFLTLENKQARTYTTIGWRMAVLLKDTYMPILICPERHSVDQVAEAESWRRIFYRLRYCEICMEMIYNGHVDFTMVLQSHTGVGYPILLPCEAQDEKTRQASLTFRFGVELMLLPETPSDVGQAAKMTRHRMDMGVLEKTPTSHIEHIEMELAKLWVEQLQHHRISDGLTEYIRLDRVREVSSEVIRMNLYFYLTWMTMEIRIMEPPSNTDLSGASFNRLDGDRALILVSVCCDALTHLFQMLHYRMPCAVELHWLIVTVDVLGRLTACGNAAIRSRAVLNLQIASIVLRKSRREYSGFSCSSSCASPPSSQGSMSSDHSSSTVDSDQFSEDRSVLVADVSTYFDELHKRSDDYFETQSLTFEPMEQ